MFSLFDDGIDWVSQGQGYWIVGRWVTFVICFFAAVCLAGQIGYVIYKLAYRGLLNLGIIPNPRPIPWLDNPSPAKSTAPTSLITVGRPSALAEAERVGNSAQSDVDDEFETDLNDGADFDTALRPEPADDEPQSMASLSNVEPAAVVLPPWIPKRRTPMSH